MSTIVEDYGVMLIIDGGSYSNVNYCQPLKRTIEWCWFVMEDYTIQYCSLLCTFVGDYGVIFICDGRIRQLCLLLFTIVGDYKALLIHDGGLYSNVNYCLPLRGTMEWCLSYLEDAMVIEHCRWLSGGWWFKKRLRVRFIVNYCW